MIMRLVFMGSPDFAIPSLRALAESKHELAAVVTQPDRPRGRGRKPRPTPVKELAKLLGIRVYEPVKLEEIWEPLAQIQPLVIVVVAYGKILPPEVLRLPKLGCINVHASLLPKYRGAAPIHRAIINGETKTGVTTMFMEEGLDTGDILLQEAITIGENETAGQLHDRLAEKGAGLLLKTLGQLESGELKRVSQKHAEATYAPPLTSADEIIDWNKPARQVKDQVRGLNPWPGACTTWNGKILKIWQVELVTGTKREEGTMPGTVLQADPARGIEVQTGKGTVLVTKLQRQGGKRLDAGQFLRGHLLFKGAVLGQ